jgi:NADH-quinone oxidoreductase subunit N
MSFLLYLVFYCITSLVVVCVLLYLEASGAECVYFTDLAQLRGETELILLTVVCAFFSFSAIPPFVGFYTKLFLILELMSGQFYVGVVLILLTSLISVFYYVRIIKTVFVSSIPIHNAVPKAQVGLYVFFVLCNSLLIGFFLFSDACLTLCAFIINELLQPMFFSPVFFML